MFAQFEFRSLFSRLKAFFGKNQTSPPPTPLFVKERVASRPGEVSIDPVKLQEASIALWLLNSDIANPNLEDILMFAKTDSFEVAYEYIFKKLKEKNPPGGRASLEKVYEEIERPIIRIVKDMENYGILIDKKYFLKLSAEYYKELDKLTAKIYKMAGTKFNLNSPKQLGEVLFDKMAIKSSQKRKRLPAGKPGSFSTKVSVLEELEEENPIIKEILAYRELQKLLSTYIDVIPKIIGTDDRLHSKFLQNNTTTGRFSSQDPNLQNLPIKTELGKRIRGGFIASQGYKLVAFDYSQIELRIVAMLSGDKKMTQVFREKKDIHAGVASFVFGVPIDKVDNEMRRKAKVINFGIIYGMGVSALRKNLGGHAGERASTREEAQKFYDNYFNQFFGVRDYLSGVKKFAVERLYTETLFGRRRNFPNINSRIPFLKNMAERTATNAPIQGTAADIIKLAMRYADEDLEKNKLLKQVHLMLQIHDELVYEIEENALAEASQVIKNAMENVLQRSFLHYKADIPLEVHYQTGDNLGEVK